MRFEVDDRAMVRSFASRSHFDNVGWETPVRVANCPADWALGPSIFATILSLKLAEYGILRPPCCPLDWSTSQAATILTQGGVQEAQRRACKGKGGHLIPEPPIFPWAQTVHCFDELGELAASRWSDKPVRLLWSTDDPLLGSQSATGQSAHQTMLDLFPQAQTLSIPDGQSLHAGGPA